MTSPARMLAVVLSQLRELDVPWAVPQGEAAVEAVLTGGGDLDLVAAVPAGELVDRLLRVQDEVRVIALNQYDIGRGDSFWCVDREAGHHLAVDVLCDPRGSGRLGIPTEQVLRSVVPGDVPATSEAWRVAYLVSKRVQKGQWERLASLRTAACAADLQEVLGAVLGAPAAAEATALLVDRADADRWRAAAGRLHRGRQQQRRARAAAGAVGIGVLHVRRAAARVRQPVGFWVHVRGEGSHAVATELTSTVGAALVHRTVLQAPSAVDRARVASVVARPGLAVTWSRGDDVPHLPAPMLVLGPSDHATAREQVVDAMQDRLRARRRSADRLAPGLR